MLYKGILHTHITIVAIYMMLFLVKVFFLLGNNDQSLAKFRKQTKVIGEMILPTLFLLTGIYLAINSHYAGQPWFIIKMLLIAISIVLGIITFRINNKILGVLTFLIFVYIFSISYMKSPDLQEHPVVVASDSGAGNTNNVAIDGKAIYESTCVSCHGADGASGMAGAANLQTSTMDQSAIAATIINGKNNMPAYKGQLSNEQVEKVAAYVQHLRK